MKLVVKKVRWSLTIALVLLALVASDGSLSSVWAKGEVFSLGEVVVSGVDSGVEAVGTTVSVDADTISRRGVRTLNEALALVPGVSVRVGNDGTPRIDIRGYRTRNVLLLLDGIPLNSTFDGQFDPASIPVEHIAAIKLTTGSSSVLYGPGGNGGVINIISKKGLNGVHGTTAAEVGQDDALLGKVSVSGSGEALDTFIGLSSSTRDGFRLSDDFVATAEEDGGLRENSDRKDTNLFANLGYAVSENTLLGFSFNYNTAEYGKPPVVNFDKNDPFTKSPKYERLDDQEGFAGQFAFSHTANGPLSLRGWAFFNTLDVTENGYDDSTYSTQVKNGSYSSDSTTETAGGSVQLTYDLQARGSTTLALSGQNETWKSTGFKIGKKGTTLLNGKEDLQIYSAALEYTVSPVDHLGVVLGFGQHYQERDADNEDAYSYLIGLHYDLSTGTRLKLSHARKIRFPSIKQLYDVNGGNTALHAERTLNYEIGVEQTLPAAISIALTLFQNNAKDFIEKDSNSINQNFEDYRFRGAEIVIENRAVENLLLRATYAYLEAKDRSTGSQKDELQYRPQDTITLEAGYDFPFGLTANASLLYVGTQYFYSSDGLQKKELADYTLVNLKLDQALLGQALHIYGVAENIFDTNYEQSYGIPLAGRTLSAGLEYRF